MFSPLWPVLWTLCWAVTTVSAVLATRSRRAMLVGRLAVATLMLVGGATFNVLQLARGNDYSGFADDAHFGWVTRAWEAIVPPHAAVLIGLLVAYEVLVGVLVLSGGRRTRLGYAGAIAFHVGLGLFFSWFLTGYAVLMVAALALLQRAEWRSAPTTTATHPAPPVPARPAAGGVPPPRREGPPAR